eukprot:gene4149-5190_t
MSSDSVNNNGVGGGGSSNNINLSSLGRRATFSKAKSFKKSNLNLEVSSINASGQNHVYRLLNGEEYSGPDIGQSPPITPRPVPPTVNLDSEESKIPIFLGANGTLYNKYYIPIKIIGIDDPSPRPHHFASSQPQPQQQTNSNHPPPIPKVPQFNSNDNIYCNFPEHTNYENYFDYEQALIDWKQQVQQSLGVVQLPSNMGRTYSRPKVIFDRFLVRKNSEASNDDSLSYDSERKLTDSDLKDSGIDEDGSFSHSPSDTHRLGGGNGTGVGGGNNKDDDLGKDGASRDRSSSDTSTGSFDVDGNSIPEGSSPLDGSPSGGSLMAGLLVNGTRSRSNSSTFFDHRINRSNSLSPKQTLQRLSESGDFKMGRGGSMLNIDEDRWILTKDPWDSQLILKEPIPELYNTYEEYEFSMKNWAIEVVSKTQILPPHSSQLIQLPSSKDKMGGFGGLDSDSLHHGAKRAHEPSTDGSHLMKFDEWKVRSGLILIKSEESSLNQYITYRERVYRPLIRQNSLLASGSLLDAASADSKLWKKLDNETKTNISDAFEKWYRKKLTIHRQSTLNHRGGIWSNHLLMPHIPVGFKESSQKKLAILPPTPIKACRRLDINSETDGRRVDLGIMMPEIPIDFTKLLQPNMNLQYLLGMFQTLVPQNPFAPQASISQEEQKQYIKTLRTYDRRLIDSYRFDPLYSWFENRQSQADPQSQKQEIETIVNQSPFDINGIWSLVCSPSVFLDKFQECFDMNDYKLYGPTLPTLSSVVPTIGVGNNGQAGVGVNNSSSSPNTGARPPGTPTSSPHVNSILGSPPSRSGSLGSFSFGSPASNKILLSPTQSSSVLSGIESPRQSSQASSLSSSNASFINNTGGSPRNISANQPSSSNLSSSLSSTPQVNGPTPCTISFLNAINTNSFPTLLSFFDRTNDPLTIAKICTLTIISLSSDKGALLLENLIVSKDITSLYRIAQAISHFDAVQFDLFPYPIHLSQMLIPAIAKGSTQEVIRLVFMYYYLNVIWDRLPFYSSNPTVMSCISASKKDTSERLGNQIQNDKELLVKIFKALGRKSSFISHSFLFILIQLMNITESSTIQSFLRLKDGIMPHLRDLCHSKFLHSQFAARRIFSILQEEQWKEFLYSEYMEKDTLMTDLTISNEKGSNSLLSELVFNMCINALDSITSSASKPAVKFLLNETIFYQIYNAVVKSKKFDQNVENLSKLFAHLCKKLVRFNMIKKIDNIKINKKNNTEQEIQISPTYMFEILSFVQNGYQIQNTDKINASIKTNILIALRHLLKPSDLFEILKKEANLYNKLLVAGCREGKNAEFNRNSWRLLFQMIRFHPSHIEFLEKNKYLNQLMDIISLNAGNVVLTNALHYLTKLFSLVLYENRRATLWKGTCASDTKHTEKDVKTLRDFFIDRHLFIKIHIIYKNFVENYPGISFIQLANLYQAISSLPICQKLLKDTIKNPDYKEEINTVAKWFNENTTIIR